MLPRVACIVVVFSAAVSLLVVNPQLVWGSSSGSSSGGGSGGNDGDDESQLQTTNELLTLRGEDMQRVLMGSYVHPLSSKAQHSPAQG